MLLIRDIQHVLAHIDHITVSDFYLLVGPGQLHTAHVVNDIDHVHKINSRIPVDVDLVVVSDRLKKQRTAAVGIRGIQLLIVMPRDRNVGIPHQRNHADSLLLIVERDQHHAVGITVPGLIPAVNPAEQDVVDIRIHDRVHLGILLVHLLLDIPQLRLIQRSALKPILLRRFLFIRFSRKRLKLFDLIIGHEVCPADQAVAVKINSYPSKNNHRKQDDQDNPQNPAPPGASWLCHQRVSILISRHLNAPESD